MYTYVMKAVILAGGKGKRLRPLTNKVPKPMIIVGGKPILLHIIELLKKNGISEYILALCYLPNAIIDFFGDGAKYRVNIKYTFEDPNNPMGTAGAILASENFIDETFIVTYGDILRDLDVVDMVSFHNKNKSFATLNVYKRESKGAKSKILIEDKKRITQFIERPTDSNLKDNYVWVNGSFYILEPEIFEYIPKKQQSDFGRDVFPLSLSKGKRLFAYPSNNYFLDIGDIKKLGLAKKKFNKV